MDRIIDIVSVVGGFLGLVVTPAIVAVIQGRKSSKQPAPSDGAPAASFGMGFSVETAVERGDRIANDYLLDLRSQRDEAKALASANALEARTALAVSEEFEDRLAAANAALRQAGLPTF